MHALAIRIIHSCAADRPILSEARGMNNGKVWLVDVGKSAPPDPVPQAHIHARLVNYAAAPRRGQRARWGGRRLQQGDSARHHAEQVLRGPMAGKPLLG